MNASGALPRPITARVSVACVRSASRNQVGSHGPSDVGGQAWIHAYSKSINRVLYAGQVRMAVDRQTEPTVTDWLIGRACAGQRSIASG